MHYDNVVLYHNNTRVFVHNTVIFFKAFYSVMYGKLTILYYITVSYYRML